MFDIKLESIRRDIHASMLGLLWILAIVVIFVSPDDVRRAAGFLDSTAQLMSHVSIPQFAVGFILVIIGVLLPYCMFQVFEPLTLAVMNICLRAGNYIWPQTNSLSAAALAAMQTMLGRAEFDQVPHWTEVFVEGFLPRLAASLALEHQINAFRWKALLPGALVVVAFVARVVAIWLPTPWPYLIGWCVGFVMFVIGFSTARAQRNDEEQSLCIALLIAAKNRTKAPQ
jgi:hypothetical protein